MKCVVCNGPVVDLQIVEEEIKSGNDIVLMNVEALVCPDCGERYYDRRAMRKIEEARHRLTRRELKMKVIGNVYRAEAA